MEAADSAGIDSPQMLKVGHARSGTPADAANTDVHCSTTSRVVAPLIVPVTGAEQIEARPDFNSRWDRSVPFEELYRVEGLARPLKANGKLIQLSLRALRGHKCAAAANNPANLVQPIDLLKSW